MGARPAENVLHFLVDTRFLELLGYAGKRIQKFDGRDAVGQGEVGAVLDQDFRGFRPVFDEGVLQERASSDEAGVDVGAAFEERFHDFRIHPGIKKGGHAVTVAGVDIGAAFNEEPDNFWLFGHGGVMKRRHLGMVLHVDAAARSQTLAYAADIAFLCGPEKVVLVGFSG